MSGPGNFSHEPHKFNFLQLCRRLEAASPGSPRMGCSKAPGQENFRLGQKPSLAFAPREIAEINTDTHGRARILLYGLGLYGPQGPLPLYLTEMANTRTLANDRGLADFLDLFHHRWLSFFYKAWAVHQSAAGLDRADDERFSGYIGQLTGQGPKESGPLPGHAVLRAACHLILHSRHPDGLTDTLEYYFKLPFAIEEFPLSWLKLEPEDLSRLSARPRRTACLGRDAVLGRYVPDKQSSFIIHLGPLPLKDYYRFLPAGPDLPELRAWIREFIGFDLEWSLYLSLCGQQVPDCRLGRHVNLGRNSWLKRPVSEEAIAGKRFTPEKHMRKNRSHDGELF